MVSSIEDWCVSNDNGKFFLTSRNFFDIIYLNGIIIKNLNK